MIQARRNVDFGAGTLAKTLDIDPFPQPRPLSTSVLQQLSGH